MVVGSSIRVIALSLFYCSCIAQGDRQGFSIEILNDSIKVPLTHPNLTLSVRYNNDTNENLLLYGFKSNLIKPAENVNEFCANDQMGAGIATFIYDSENDNIFASFDIPRPLKYKPLPKDAFENSMARLKLEYLSGTEVAPAKKSRVCDIEIDLKDFNLQPGKYFIQLVYYSGTMVEKVVVGTAEVERDKLLHKADLFQGCVISNRVTFTVAN